jgi:hypothetical protein
MNIIISILQNFWKYNVVRRKLVSINNTFSDKVCVLLYTMLQSSAWTYYNLFIFEKYQRQTIVSKSKLNLKFCNSEMEYNCARNV